MFHNPFSYEFSPLYLAQLAFTVWMLVDAYRRRVEFYWYWIILFFQPVGAWAYFFVCKARDFRVNQGSLTRLFDRPPSLQELRHRAERSGTLATRLELAERLVDAGEHAEALPHLEAVLAREADHCQALFLLARSHRALGHPEQAMPALQKLIARHPSWRDYDAWHTLIDIRRESGDAAGALASCRELARVAPRLEHKCLFAEHLLMSGEKVEAGNVLEQGLEDYHYLTGLSRRRDRRWAGKAKQLLKQIN
jgi:hypothetical protein